MGHGESQKKSLGSSDPGNRFNLYIFKMAAIENFNVLLTFLWLVLDPINVLATDINMGFLNQIHIISSPYDIAMTYMLFSQLLCFVAKRYTQEQVSEEVNRKCPARNTTVQLSAPNTDPFSHFITDGQMDRQTTVLCAAV